jgi:uncharacterized protein YbjQ (UPF0145 family)
VVNQNTLGTQVVLSQKNFKVVSNVKGCHTVARILGIGGLSKKAMQENAIAEMFKNANLTSSQAVVNITYQYAVKGVPPFFTQNVCTATGTVVEFTE